MAYVGLMVGAAKGDYLDLSALGGIFSDKVARRDLKILDTSVIIDGRIADVAETGFLTGSLIIPQFILRELQQVADSPDSSKRQRGRRGLDMLNRLQNNSSLDIQIVETDFPSVREVDLKLIELGKQLDAVIVTNDFNLNKVSQLRGVSVLNINELANALKPVVLPGEAMRVFILKEGKEYNQGVAYLDDGTMVVVDNARRLIGKNADIAVTSVLQTTAGKMIFGRLWEEAENGGTQRYSSHKWRNASHKFEIRAALPAQCALLIASQSRKSEPVAALDLTLFMNSAIIAAAGSGSPDGERSTKTVSTSRGNSAHLSHASNRSSSVTASTK